MINPVRGFPSAGHQMLPSSHIDSHTTQTAVCHPKLHFPSSIALITHTAATNQTHFISHGLLCPDCEYCLVFLTLLVITTLRSQFPVLSHFSIPSTQSSNFASSMKNGGSCNACTLYNEMKLYQTSLTFHFLQNIIYNTLFVFIFKI